MTPSPPLPDEPARRWTALPPVSPTQRVPGSPSWPGWLAIVIGIIVLFTGLGAAAAVQTGELVAESPEVYGWAALVGAVLLLAGLVWLAVRGLRLRRWLPPDRYRGPSVFLLIFIVLTAGNLVSIPFVAASLLGGGGGGLEDPFTLSVILFITPLIFLAVTAVFVLLPAALPGLRLTDGADTLRNFLRGLVIGVPTWVVASVVSLLIALAIQLVTGSEPEGQQAVLELVARIPPPVAFLAVGLLAPIAEEVFFRGTVFNAWEREYGPRRALIGSALIFAAIHLVDGAWLAFAPILVVGLVLGLAYARTRSLPLVTGIHAGFNLISTALVFIVGPQAG